MRMLSNKAPKEGKRGNKKAFRFPKGWDGMEFWEKYLCEVLCFVFSMVHRFGFTLFRVRSYGFYGVKAVEFLRTIL